MTVKSAPYVKVSWNNTGLTTAFGYYRVWRRISRGVAGPWYVVAQYSVPTGYSSTTVEGRHTIFYDYEAGWAVANGQWDDGWQYAVSVLNKNTGVESVLTVFGANTRLVADTNPWLVCNQAPYLNQPFERLRVADVEDDDRFQDYQVAGRDLSVVRMQDELAAKRYSLSWVDTGSPLSEDLMRLRRAAANAGKTVCLHLPSGDRFMGAFASPRIRHSADMPRMLDCETRFIETTRQPEGVITNMNLPAGSVMNGSNQHISCISSTTTNPGSNGFTVILLAGFGSNAASKYFLSKGNGGTADGYFFRSTGTSNQIEFFVDGASTTASCLASGQSALYDGELHVLVGTSTGTAQALYLDGATTPIATASATHGAVTNALGLCVGANNVTDSSSAGASLSAMTPVVAWGVWPSRVLSAAEAQAAAYYLKSYPGYRIPGGMGAFFDLRDSRCWPGYGTQLVDLAGNNNYATLKNSPETRGIPWDLRRVDAF